MSRPPAPGQAFEAVMHAGQRIRAAHLILGLIGAFSVWTGALQPNFNVLWRGGGLPMVVFSIFGWGPYVISWIYARTVLKGLNKAVSAFSASALLVTLIAVGLYQNLFGFTDKPPTVLVSAGVTISLLALARVCSGIWGPS